MMERNLSETTRTIVISLAAQGRYSELINLIERDRQNTFIEGMAFVAHEVERDFGRAAA